MKSRSIARIMLGAAVTAAVLLIPSVVHAGSKAKRVWTDDDFASTKAQAEAAPTPKPVAAAPAEPAPEQVRRQVQQEMVATARVRQKAFEQTINEIKAKLDAETDSFRREVYQRILNETMALNQNNQRLLERYAERSPASAQEKRP